MRKKFLLLAAVMLIVIPLVVIWALRALGAPTEYSFESWLAVVVLATAIKQVGK